MDKNALWPGLAGFNVNLSELELFWKWGLQVRNGSSRLDKGQACAAFS